MLSIGRYWVGARGDGESSWKVTGSPMCRVARSSMFKSSIFCPKQYIFAVLAVNVEKELTPPFELICFALGQVHFIQCLSSVLLLQSSIILHKAVHLATLPMWDSNLGPYS